MWIFSAVANLLFGDGTVNGKLPLIAFAAGSACIGVLVVVADALQHQLTKTSLLKLDYQGKNVFLFMLIWVDSKSNDCNTD
jgi:hypothetical protein